MLGGKTLPDVDEGQSNITRAVLAATELLPVYSAVYCCIFYVCVVLMYAQSLHEITFTPHWGILLKASRK